MLSSLGCISQFSLDVLGTLDSIFSTEALAGHLKGRGGAAHSNIWLDVSSRPDAMADWWPSVDEGVLARLQRVFETPLKLDAAFDTDEDCAVLLESEFPDMLPEDSLDTVAQLCLWKEQMSRPLKRARAELVHRSMFRLPQPGRISVQEEFVKLTRTSAICILEMHVKQKQKSYKEDPADARMRRYEAERKKYSKLLSQVLMEANLPICDLVRTLEDPMSGWLHLFAARRGNTLPFE